MQLAPGDRLEKYVLERLLGTGGMGAVWLAHDEDLDRRVALKVLRPTLANDETARARLVREARAMARLRHPNVITVYDASSAGGYDFVVMELVDGQTMAGWLASATRAPEDVLAVLVAAGRGLAAAHAAGMVHRDFKPHNVLVDSSGRVLVTDFGLARALDDDADGAPETIDPAVTMPGGPSGRRKLPSRPPNDPGDLDSPLTRTGHVLGTPAYMAPEQFLGLRADERADQFSFCVTAWEALSGSRPFPGALTQDIVAAIDAQQPVAPDRVPRRLRAVLRRGMRSDPASRWRSIDHLVGALVRAWKRPRTIAIASAAAVVIAGGVIAGVLAMQDSPAAASPCGRGRDALATSWSRDALRTKLALAANDLVLVDLDHWTSQWAEAFDGNCARPDDADFAARKVCLDGQRDELASLVSGMDAKLLESLRHFEIALVLPSPESCVRAPRVIAPPLPGDPGVRARVTELRRSLLRLELDATPPATYEAIGGRARQLIDDAKALNYVPVEAEALLTLANVRRNLVPADDAGMLAAYHEASQQYAVAAERAETVGYDRLRTDAMLGQLEAAVLIADRFEPLDDMVRRTELTVTRLGDPARELALEIIRVDIAFQQNLWSQTIERAARARANWLRRSGRALVVKTATLEAEARELRHANDDLDIADKILEDTLALPLTAAARAQLQQVAGRIALRRGKVDEARDAFSQAAVPYPELTNGGGDPAGGSVAGTVTGIAPGTLADTVSYTRRTLATITIDDASRRADRRWSILADVRGHFELAAIPPGRYTVTVTVASSAGDIHGVRSKIDVKAGARTEVTIDLPVPTRLDTMTVDELDLIEGIVVVLGTSAVPKTPAAFRAAFAEAPWFTASAFDTTNQAILGPTHTVCMVGGSMIDESGRFATDPTAVDCMRGQ